MGRTRAGYISLNKQPGLLSVSSALERRGSAGYGGGGCGIELGGGEKLGSTAVLSHSARTGVICAWFAVTRDTTALCHAT